MKQLPCGNHNTAYYPWLKEQTADCRRILDMGAVRRAVRTQLPGARLEYGLHYRWLLKWRKEKAASAGHGGAGR